MAKNVYRVPKKQWGKWSKKAQAVFNNVFFFSKNFDLMGHPKTKKISIEEWKTIRWNFAWMAANATDGYQTEVQE